jgi:hypothetical protein
MRCGRITPVREKSKEKEKMKKSEFIKRANALVRTLGGVVDDAARLTGKAVSPGTGNITLGNSGLLSPNMATIAPSASKGGLTLSSGGLNLGADGLSVKNAPWFKRLFESGRLSREQKIGLAAGGAGLAGGWIPGRLTGYSLGDQDGLERGLTQGGQIGFDTAMGQARNTPFFSRMMGRYQFDPSSAMQQLQQFAGSDDAYSGRQTGVINRLWGVPGFGR